MPCYQAPWFWISFFDFLDPIRWNLAHPRVWLRRTPLTINEDRIESRISKLPNKAAVAASQITKSARDTYGTKYTDNKLVVLGWVSGYYSTTCSTTTHSSAEKREDSMLWIWRQNQRKWDTLPSEWLHFKIVRAGTDSSYMCERVETWVARTRSRKVKRFCA
jgi:hypothetical protein